MFLSNRWYKREGVTLVEILVAFIMITVVAFGAMGLISHGSKMTRHDFIRDEAIQILVDKLNGLSALPYKTLKETLSNALSISTPGNIGGVQFGTIKKGNNTYNTRAYLYRQNITFNNLMELDFTKGTYVDNDPNTWNFKSRAPVSFSGANHQIIKIKVTVAPQGKVVKTDKIYEAITFVCNMED